MVAPMLAADAGYLAVAAQVAVAAGFALIVLLLTHLVGPKRVGPQKHSTYESGMTPVGDARKRFNVKFYLIAVLFLIFDVEIVFLIPWAMLFPRLRSPMDAEQSAWAEAMLEAGYGPGFMLGAILIFFVILLVGFAYEWRKGIFKWD